MPALGATDAAAISDGHNRTVILTGTRKLIDRYFFGRLFDRVIVSHYLQPLLANLEDEAHRPVSSSQYAPNGCSLPFFPSSNM